MILRGGAWLLLLSGALMGQNFDKTTLSGKYYFRHLLFSTDSASNIAAIRSLTGALNFDGAGNFACTGQQTVGANPSAALNSSGTYSVNPAGIVSLTNPQDASLMLNARLGNVDANENMIIGSSTEGSANAFDLFVALKAADAPTSNVLLNGAYHVSTLAFPSADSSQVRGALFQMQADGAGGFGDIVVSGHASNLSHGAPIMQALTGATYAMQADGSGTASFPVGPGNIAANQLLSGNETIYVSAGGNVILGGSSDPGVHDLLIGFKSKSGLAWTGEFWNAGLRFDTAGAASAYSGSLFSTGSSVLTLTRRLHQLQPAGAVSYDFTGVNSFSLAVSGLGTAELTSVALGAAGNGFTGASLNSADPTGYELFLGVRMPLLAGSGVFLNPQGVANAASFAPPGDPIAPGEFVALFGTNLANGAETARPPYPSSLGGVTVTINGRLAPLQFVSPTRINLLAPYATEVPSANTLGVANIVVNNNGQASNSVPAPVAATAPGIFSTNQNGIGPGAILHKDFSLVRAARPAKRGETVQVFLTGLGAVNPTVTDGTAGGSTPLSKAVAEVGVVINGETAAVSYAGLAPGFPGLYQINVTVPPDLAITKAVTVPLAIQTPGSFHDQVDIVVSP